VTRADHAARPAPALDVDLAALHNGETRKPCPDDASDPANRSPTLLAHGGLRRHNPRHSYPTWLVDDGVLPDKVQRVLGHERATTALDRYTRHTAAGACLRWGEVAGLRADVQIRWR
jgi:hypothetical protein